MPRSAIALLAALPLALATLAAPPSLAAPKATQKKGAAHAAKTLKAVPARIKQMHDAKIKRALGLPTFSFGRGYSTIETKWHTPFRVSPPVEDWVTDYAEAEGSAYRVRLSKIGFPDSKEKRSLYTDAQKAELFKNMIGHLYNVKGAQLDKVIASADGKALFATFSEKIDDGGFDFPMAIPAPR